MNKIIKISILGTMIFVNNSKSTILDVIEFVSNKKNREIKQPDWPGLSSQTSLNVSNWLVSQQKYIPALKHLWNEKNKELRLKWLHEKADEGHAIMMLELSYQLYDMNKLEDSYYWYCLGIRKTTEDVFCYKDESVKTKLIKVNDVYDTHRFVGKLSEERILYIAKKAHQDLKNWNKRPSPIWFAPENELLPESEWQNARKKSMEQDRITLENPDILKQFLLLKLLEEIQNQDRDTSESKKSETQTLWEDLQ